MKRLGWIIVTIIGIAVMLGCSNNNIVSPSIQLKGPVDHMETPLAEYWDILGQVTNSNGQPLSNVPVYIVVHHTTNTGDSTARFLVHTDDNGNYILDNAIVYIYNPVVTVSIGCKYSEPPEAIRDKPDGWGGDFYSIINFRVNSPYCLIAPIK